MLPDTYIFNPTCEPAIANGSPYYTAPARLRQFESDLGYLPAWLAEKSDHVLVQGAVDPDYHNRVSDMGIRLADVFQLNLTLVDPEWVSLPKGRIFPWGWSPAICYLFKDVLTSYREEFQESSVAIWRQEHKKMYSRLTSVGLMTQFLGESPASWLPSLEELPIVCTSGEQVCSLLAKMEQAVVKTPWSSSGRGLLLFPNQDSQKKNDEVLSGMFHQQSMVTLEPWLNKVADLSFQFTCFRGKIQYMGRTFFETDPKGRYLRNYLNDSISSDSAVYDFLETHHSEVVSLLLFWLSRSDYQKYYEGWIGVDSLVYRSAAGELRFHPMIEINGRFTMGAIALKLRRLLAEGSSGFLQIFYSKSGNFQDFSLVQERRNPLVMSDGKIVSGFFPLTPPLKEHHFGAYVEVTHAQRCS